MPCSLDMPLDPFLNRGDVIFSVLQVVSHIFRLATGYKTRLRCSSGLVLDAPAAVLDTCAKVVGSAVGLGVFEIEILGGGRGFICVESGLYVNPGPSLKEMHKR